VNGYLIAAIICGLVVAACGVLLSYMDGQLVPYCRLCESGRRGEFRPGRTLDCLGRCVICDRYWIGPIVGPLQVGSNPEPPAVAWSESRAGTAAVMTAAVCIIGMLTFFALAMWDRMA
jgi:hypothetical protein